MSHPDRFPIPRGVLWRHADDMTQLTVTLAGGGAPTPDMVTQLANVAGLFNESRKPYENQEPPPPAGDPEATLRARNAIGRNWAWGENRCSSAEQNWAVNNLDAGAVHQSINFYNGEGGPRVHQWQDTGGIWFVGKDGVSTLDVNKACDAYIATLPFTVPPDPLA